MRFTYAEARWPGALSLPGAGSAAAPPPLHLRDWRYLKSRGENISRRQSGAVPGEAISCRRGTAGCAADPAPPRGPVTGASAQGALKAARRSALFLETCQGTQGGAQEVLVLRHSVHIQGDWPQRHLLAERLRKIGSTSSTRVVQVPRRSSKDAGVITVRGGIGVALPASGVAVPASTPVAASWPSSLTVNFSTVSRPANVPPCLRRPVTGICVSTRFTPTTSLCPSGTAHPTAITTSSKNIKCRGMAISPSARYIAIRGLYNARSD